MDTDHMHNTRCPACAGTRVVIDRMEHRRSSDCTVCRGRGYIAARAPRTVSLARLCALARFAGLAFEMRYSLVAGHPVRIRFSLRLVDGSRLATVVIMALAIAGALALLAWEFGMCHALFDGWLGCAWHMLSGG